MKKWVLGLASVSIVGLSACDPIPGTPLSKEAKIADMYWVYSQFSENYAPLELKESLYHFKYEKLKADYLAAAVETKTNDEFYVLLNQFVAEFKDAHTSGSLTSSAHSDRAQVAFLGFSGIRNGDDLIVKKLLPTIAKDSAYPIKTGDKIKKLNGKTLAEVIKAELLPTRNVGDDEANLTYSMNKLFTRLSYSSGLPKDSDAVLTVERGTDTLELKLPWVVKDLYQFQLEQDKAKTAAEKKTADAPEEEKNKAAQFMMISDAGGKLFGFNFVGFDGRLINPMDDLKKFAGGMGKTLRGIMNSFQFHDRIEMWSGIDGAEGQKVLEKKKNTPLEALGELRSVPKNALYVSGSETYPAYIAPQKVLDKDRKATKETRLVGYIYVDTFSPDADEKDVIKEFAATLESMQSMGVKELVIDTINNGGGSLELGMKMAQLLSPKRIELPKIQFKLSNSWIDEFDSMYRAADSDAEGELARRVLQGYTDSATGQRVPGLLEDLKAGKTLSSVHSAEVLSPFAFTANSKLEAPFKVTLLINEMCASMCDIFAGILQDNQMATLVGTKSMGAGGNVVNHNQAPNSHFDVRQTESLMVRKDGSYIENKGVTPDVKVNVASLASEKYAGVLKKAVEILMTPEGAKAEEVKPTATPTPTPAKK